MTQERWSRLEEIFGAAIDLQPGERERYLTEACLGDSGLLEDVRAMLAVDGKAAAFLTEGIQREAERLSSELSTSVIGQRIGTYRITGILGRGGMGAVYLAVRDDDVYEKPVALKVVKRGMDTDEVVRRFRQER